MGSNRGRVIPEALKMGPTAPVDCSVLIQELQERVGLSGSAISNESGGVPQGSILGPILF